MHTYNLKLSPIAMAALLLVSAAAHAQTTAVTADEAAIPTVTVTASADASADGLPKPYAGGQVARGGRMGILGNVDTMSSPFGSTSYTQEFIVDQQARSIGDLLQSDPAVHMSRGYGNFQEVYVMRGFALNSDDVGYNGLYGVLPRQYVSPELLERVEVFRGASSFLNGAAPGGSGVGGAINLVPKRAGNTPLTEVTAGIETGGHGYGAVDLGRRFGESNEFGVRVNAAKRKGETSVDNEGHEVSMFSVGLDYRGRDYRLSADLGYQDFKLTSPRPNVSTGLVSALPAPPDGSSNFAQPWSFSNERDVFGTVRGEYDIAKDVVAWAAYGERSTKESNSLGQPSLLSTNGDSALYRFDNTRKQTIRTGELGIRGKLQTGSVKHTLVASMSGHWNDARNAYGMSPFNALATNIFTPVAVAIPEFNFLGGVLADPKTTQKTILSSFAIADTMALLDDSLLLTVGARRQKIKDTGYDYTTGVSADPYDMSATTPVLGLVYKVNQNVSVYGNYIEALVQGPNTGNPLFSTVPFSNAFAVLAPYKSKQKEIGVKYDAGKLGLTAALFETGKPLLAVKDGVAGMSGEQRHRGLEMSVYGVPMRDVRLLGGLTLLDSEQRDTSLGKTDGNDAIGVPKTQLNMSGEWDVPGAKGLTLTARTVYTSSQYADLANTKQLPSWTRFDLGARYVTTIADRTVTIRARVDNVADRNYWSAATSAFDAGELVLGTPRTLVLTGTVAF